MYFKSYFVQNLMRQIFQFQKRIYSMKIFVSLTYTYYNIDWEREKIVQYGYHYVYQAFLIRDTHMLHIATEIIAW